MRAGWVIIQQKGVLVSPFVNFAIIGNESRDRLQRAFGRYQNFSFDENSFFEPTPLSYPREYLLRRGNCVSPVSPAIQDLRTGR